MYSKRASIFSILSFNQFSTFNHSLLLMLYNTSESSFKVKFLPTSLPLGHVHPLCHSHFSHLWWKAPFTKFLCCLESLSNGGSGSIPTVTFFSCHPRCVWFELQHYPFLLLFLSCFHLWSIHFYQMSHALITGRPGVSTMTCFAVCAWTCDTWVVTHHQKTRKEVKWLAADHNVHQLFM